MTTETLAPTVTVTAGMALYQRADQAGLEILAERDDLVQCRVLATGAEIEVGLEAIGPVGSDAPFWLLESVALTPEECERRLDEHDAALAAAGLRPGVDRKKLEFELLLARQGWLYPFPQLFSRRTGQRVNAVLLTGGRRPNTWAFLDERGRSTGRLIADARAKRSPLYRAGYEVRLVPAQAKVVHSSVDGWEPFPRIAPAA